MRKCIIIKTPYFDYSKILKGEKFKMENEGIEVLSNVLKRELPQKLFSEKILIPRLLAKTSCGLFGISDDFIEKYQSLDSLYVKNKFSTFFFEAMGDSMEPTIRSGQVLVVDRSRTDYWGRVAVLAYEDKLICKRIIRIGRESGNGLILRSDNSKYKDILIENSESINFWGLVIATTGFIE